MNILPQDEKPQTDMAEREKKKRSKVDKVFDYLAAPTRKKKNYIALAFGNDYNADEVRAYQKFLQTHYPKNTLLIVKNEEELLKHLSKNIILLLIDDSISKQRTMVELAKMLKISKPEISAPVLFFTSQPESFIKNYRSELKEFSESDQYLHHQALSRQQIIFQLKKSIDSLYKPSARKARISLSAVFESTLTAFKKVSAEIQDLNATSARIESVGEYIFKKGENILVHIRLPQDFLRETPECEDDIIRLAGIVRSVGISGEKASVQWSSNSDDKKLTLYKLLSFANGKNMMKQAQVVRAKIGRVPMPSR